jgi:MFS family permease
MAGVGTDVAALLTSADSRAAASGPSGLPAMIVGTCICGVATGVASVLQVMVKTRFPRKLGLMNGLSTAAICASAAPGAGFSYRLFEASGSRNWALGVWTLPARAAGLVLLPLAWRCGPEMFHTAITKAAKNKILELAMTSVHLMRPATNTVFVDLLDREAIWRQHEAIYQAIADGDPEAARRAFQSHVGYLDDTRLKALADTNAADVFVASLPDASQMAAGRPTSADPA